MLLPTVWYKHNFYMHWEMKKKSCDIFYCNSLLLWWSESNPQYLWGVPVFTAATSHSFSFPTPISNIQWLLPRYCIEGSLWNLFFLCLAVLKGPKPPLDSRNNASLWTSCLFIINMMIWLGGTASKRQDVTLNIYNAVVKTVSLNYRFSPRSLHKYLAVGDRPNKSV